MNWKAEPATIGWVVRGTQVSGRRITLYDNWNSLDEGQAVMIARALNALATNSPKHAGVVFRTADEPSDVHTEHCCVLHGCAYGDDRFGGGCPVVSKTLKQSYPCETCIAPEQLIREEPNAQASISKRRALLDLGKQGCPTPDECYTTGCSHLPPIQKVLDAPGPDLKH